MAVVIPNITTVILSVFIIVVSAFIGSGIYEVLRSLLDPKLSKKTSKIMARIVEYLCIGILLYVGLVRFLGVDFGAFTASLGVMGVIIAFSSTQLLQNFLAGILISLQRPIQVEDWIEIGGAPETAVSKVRDISFMRTTLRNRDGKIILIPNSVLLTSRLTNYTKSGFVEIALSVTVPKDIDVETVREVLLTVASSNERVLPKVSQSEKQHSLKLLKWMRVHEIFDAQTSLEHLKPYVLITDISGGKVILSLRMWIREVRLREQIVSEVMQAVRTELAQKEIIL